MTKALAFDPLVQALHAQLASLPDDRKGKHIQYDPVALVFGLSADDATGQRAEQR